MSAGPREQTTEPASDVKATIAAGIRQYLSDLHAELTHDERMNLGALRTLSRIDDDADSIASYIVDDGLGLTEEWMTVHESGGGTIHHSEEEARERFANFVVRPPGVEDPGSGRLTHVAHRWVSGWSVVGEAK